MPLKCSIVSVYKILAILVKSTVKMIMQHILQTAKVGGKLIEKFNSDWY